MSKRNKKPSKHLPRIGNNKRGPGRGKSIGEATKRRAPQEQ